MSRIKLLSTVLAAAIITCLCASSARADNYRWSTDGGTTWTDATTLSGAASAVGSNDSIIEVCADNDQMFASSADFSFSGNVTIRSNGDSPFTITRNQNGKIVTGATGKEIILTNVIFKSNNGTGRFFTMSPGTLRLKTGAKFTSDMNGTANTRCALCSKSNGEIHFEGGTVDGWLSSDESPVYPSSGSKVYIDAGGIENCVNTGGTDGQDGSAIGSANGSDQIIMTGGFIRNNQHLGTSGSPSTLGFTQNATFELSGGVITNNTFASSAGYAVRLNSSGFKLKVSGSPVIADNLYGSEQHNVYVSGASVQQTADLQEGAKIGISGGSSSYLTGGATFGTTTAGLSGAEYIVNDSTGSKAEVSGTNLIWPYGARYSTNSGDTWTEVADAKAAFDAVKGGSVDAIIESRADCQLYSSSVTPTCNLTLRSWTGEDHVATLSQGGQWVNWNISSGLTLTLNNIIFKGGTQANNGLFIVNSGGSLRLEAGSRVTSAATTTSAGIIVKGNLYIAGGVISDWYLSQKAPVYLDSSSARVYISDGGIENCTQSSKSTSCGSAIASGTTSEPTDPMVVMTGGFIRNNYNSSTESATEYYGALSIREKGVVAISGGVITNNTAEGEYFAGVSIPRGEVRISGSPIISGNLAAGVVKNVVTTDGNETYEPNWPKLIQSGNLTAGAQVGVFSSKYYAKDAVFGTLSDSSYTGAEYFLNDRNNALLGSADGTNLKWEEMEVATVSLTVPSKTGLNKPTVTATVGEPEETSEGVWSVAQNSTVTLTYTAQTGYRITDGNPVEVAIGTTDRTLSENELPSVLKQVVLTIPEQDEVAVESVTGGNASVKTAGSEYYVDPSSTLSINFVAKEGYAIASGNPVEYTIGTTDATLDTFPVISAVVKPSIGALSAAVAPGAVDATISLSDVVIGTDSQGEEATSYSVSYKLDGGAAVDKLAGQTESAASFDIVSLEAGSHSCEVWIVNDHNVTSATKSVGFTITPPISGFDALKTAIEGASMNDTIYVSEGAYEVTSSITVNKKNVKVIAIGDRDKTIFDGGYPELSNTVFSVAGEGVMISGMTFRDTGKSAIAQSGSAYGVVITNCVFLNCQAEYGAGVDGNLYYGEHDAQSASVFPARGAMGVISDCVFSNCVATGTSADSGAGAVAGPFWIENSTFDACSGTACAAAILTAHNTMVTNCVFKNSPTSKRPAIYMNRATALKVLDCQFQNMACGTLFGCYSGGNILVDRCDIGNCAGEETLTEDSPVYAIFSSTGVIRNSLIHGGKNPFNIIGESYQNCTIVTNVGGLFIKFRNGGAGPSSSFTNCVFANNSKWSVYGKGDAGLQWHSVSLDENVYKNLLFGNCVLQGASDSESGLNVLLTQDSTGNTATLTAKADTKGVKFTDPENGNYIPKGGSPLVDGGVVCDWMAGALDLAGKKRIRGNAPDVGCYESGSGFAIIIR